MGALYKNGIKYGGGVSTANLVTYVNTTSGLSATNVQAAIDEVSTSDELVLDIDSGVTSAGIIQLARYGKVRVLSGYFNPSKTDASTIMAVLPLSTDYPPHDINSICGRSGGVAGLITVRNTGNIQYTVSNTGYNHFFDAAWIVE